MRYVFSSVVVACLGLMARADEPKIAYPAMPEAFSSFGAAVADDYVYVYGGHTAVTHDYSTEAVTGKFRRLNLRSPNAKWEELPASTPLQGLALVAHQGKIYRIGGMQPRNKPGEKTDNHSVASVEVFDPKTTQWSAVASMPAGRSSHDAAVVGDSIVVLGGWNLKGRDAEIGFHDTALVLDLASKSPAWAVVPQPFKRRALNVAAVGNNVYVVGGMNQDNEIEKRVDAFDVKSKTWATVAELPGPERNGFASAVCAVQGAVIASPADGKVYKLSAKGDAWSSVAQLGEKRIVHRIVPLGENRLLAIGGAATKERNLSGLEVLDISR